MEVLFIRVQFTLNKMEWSKLEKLALADGYPDVSTYCKDISLRERTYANMWKNIMDKIREMPSGSQFALKDLVQSPPSNLGVKLYNNQGKLGIKVNPQKDSSNTNTYTKI